MTLPATKAEASAQQRHAEAGQIDRYKVLKPLGEGGMGAVYLAYDPQLDRRVALKLVSAAAITMEAGAEAWATLRTQMHSEARALAQLAHPNVCTLYDIGVSDDQIFLAMEYIEGDTLRAWAERAQPNWQAVLAVMRAAGQGLAAAHAASLVHLDFKPGNVMLDKSGRAIVLDFGISQLIETSTQTTSKPANAWAAGTPAYMAPEQLAAKACDARADQYAFCLTLYELLYQTRPPRVGTYARVDSPPAGYGVPRALCTVIQRGLARDPEQRYPSMGALLEALDQVRVSSTSRVKQIWLTAALTGWLAAIAGLWFGYDHDPCPPAEAEWAKIWNEQSRAKLRSAFENTGAPTAQQAFAKASSRLDAYVDAWLEVQVDTCRQSRVFKTLQGPELDRRSLCLRGERQRISATLDQLLAADRGVVEQAPRVVYELPAPKRCAEGHELVDYESSEDTPETAKLRTQLLEIDALVRTGRPRLALERAEALQRTTALAASMAYELEQYSGDAYRQLGQPAQAAEHHRRAMSLAVRVDRREWAARAALKLIFEAGYLVGDLEQALQLLEQARAHVSAAGNQPEHYASYLAEHALVLSMQSDQRGYERMLRAALDVYEREFDDSHPTKTVVIHDLGVAKLFQHAFAEAVPFFRQAITRHEELFGVTHPEVAVMYSNYGEALANAGQRDQGLEAYLKGLDICERVAGQGAIACAIQRAGAAIVLTEMGHFSGALQHIDRLAISQTSAAYRGRPEVPAAPSLRALVELQRGQLQSAAEAAKQGLEDIKREKGVLPAVLAKAMRIVGEIELQNGELEAAARTLGQAANEARREGLNSKAELAEVLRLQGDLELRLGRAENAVTRHAEADALHVAATDARSLARVSILASQAASWASLGQAEKVQSTVGEALDILDTHLQPHHPRRVHWLLELAGHLQQAGQSAHAQQLAKAAEEELDTLRPSLAKRDPTYLKHLVQRLTAAR